MKGLPLVSVIIPSYNSSKTIKQTLESVKNQTYSNYEIIVIDDGSTDETVELLRSIKDIKLIEQTNQGVSVARNRGVEAAAGKYIAFLDSDDLWHPQKLEIQLEIAKSLKNWGMIATGYKSIYEISTNSHFSVIERPRVEMIKELSFYRFFETTFCLPSTVLIAREIFLEMGGFNQELKSGEDRDLWLKVAYKYPIYYIPLDLMRYFVREEGLARSFKVIGQINTIFIAEKWNPQKKDTLDVSGKIDYELFNKIFQKMVIKVGQRILKYRTVAVFKNNIISSNQIFDIYWRRFSYVFGSFGFLIKNKIIIRNRLKYGFRKIPNQRVDEKLIIKLLETKFDGR